MPGDMQAQRRIGLIGGTSWQSTVVYYRLLNGAANAARGGSSSASLTIHSLDFEPIHAAQVAGDWSRIGIRLAEAARALQLGGAEAVAVCANTLHLVADAISTAIDVPFLDLIGEVDARCAGRGWKTVGLLGTDYTMRSPMYPERLGKSGIEVLVPDEPDRALVHRIIYDELTHGVVTDESRGAFLAVVQRLAAAGAQAVILGCTEIGLLLMDGDASVPLLDTTVVHCDQLARFMLNNEPDPAMSARAKSEGMT